MSSTPECQFLGNWQRRQMGVGDSTVATAELTLACVAEGGRSRDLPAAQANLARGRHRVEDARDDLRRAGAARVVGELRFEQLGVGENDPELIVQSMKEETEI